MIRIILLIVGVFYFAKRHYLKRLVAAEFPEVPPDQFEEWKRLKLDSIDIFLCATWGVAIIGTIVGFVLASLMPEGPNGLIAIGCIALFLDGLIISAIKGSKAAKLKKSLGIKWPPK